MRPTDPLLRRRSRLHLTYRAFAHLAVVERATSERGRSPWTRALVSGLLDVTIWRVVSRGDFDDPARRALAAADVFDGVLWSGVGRGAPRESRAEAVVGVAAAVDAGYELTVDGRRPRPATLEHLALSFASTVTTCIGRAARRRPAGLGQLGWPVLGAAGGYAVGRYRMSEEARRSRISDHLAAEMQNLARSLAAADFVDSDAWNWMNRLEYDLLTLSAVAPHIVPAWRSIATAPPLPPVDYLRLSRVVGSVDGDDDPLLHPTHVAELVARGASRSTCRVLPSPGVRRPGERLDLDLDGERVVLPATLHRLGTDLRDRIVDPAPLVLVWGGLLFASDRSTFDPPLALVLLAAVAQWATGAAHAGLRLPAATTLRNAWLSALGILVAGAFVPPSRDGAEPAMAFGGAAFPFHLLLGHWWDTVTPHQRRVAVAGSACLGLLLVVRTAVAGGADRGAHWWVRVLLADNIAWWVMMFATAKGAERDLEVDFEHAAADHDHEADRRLAREYDDAWTAARQRIISRADLLEGSLSIVADELEPETIDVLRADVVEVRAWLAERSS